MTHYFSWNVNGLRAVGRKGFLDWLDQERPDVLGLQEIKCMPEQLTPELRQPDGYEVFFAPAERKGYSGTAIYTRIPPLDVRVGLGEARFDAEGRTIAAEFDDLIFVTTYVPSGGREGGRLEFKFEYMEALQRYCAGLAHERQKPLIVCGDINIAHTPFDLARPKQNKKTIGFLPEERAWVDRFLAMGYEDAFRAFHPDQEGFYSWWSYRKGLRERNVGWRLDMILTSVALRPRLQGAKIHRNVFGSDHCPISVECRAMHDE